ncbi:hypothetical protein DXA14_15955 [Hungatella hathewayi]|nr:hypothetical protein DXA14_15955 [Hungatella hathewayi]
MMAGHCYYSCFVVYYQLVSYGMSGSRCFRQRMAGRKPAISYSLYPCLRGGFAAETGCMGK